MQSHALGVCVLFVVLISFAAETWADLFLRYLPPATAQVSGRFVPEASTNTADDADANVRGNLDVHITQGQAMLTGYSGSGAEHVVWFDSKDQTFRILDGSGAAFFEVSPSWFQSFDEGRKRLQRELQVKLKNAPPEDHKKIISFAQGLEKRLYGTRPVMSAYRRAGVEDRVGMYSCSRTEVVREQKKIRELCLAAPEALNIETADWEVMHKMHAAGEAIFTASTMGAQLIPRIALDLGYGIPIEIRYSEPSLDSKRLLLQEVSRKKIPREKVTGYQALKKVPLPVTRATF